MVASSTSPTFHVKNKNLSHFLPEKPFSCAEVYVWPNPLN